MLKVFLAEDELVVPRTIHATVCQYLIDAIEGYLDV